jgi:hypothetical protein
MTPSDAGFDGTFRVVHSSAKDMTFRLRRCSADNENRMSALHPQELACWLSPDGTVQTFVYKSAAGTVCELPFIPIEDET